MQISELLDSAWETFKRHTGALVAATVALMVVDFVAHALLSRSTGRVLAYVLSALISGLLIGGQMNVARIAARGGTPSLNDAFAPFTERQGDYLLVGLVLSSGAIVFGIGVVVTVALFVFAPLRVVEGDDFKVALRESKNMVLANLGVLIRLLLAVFALNVLGVITVVGWLATLPITALMVVDAYKRLRAPALLAADAPVVP